MKGTIKGAIKGRMQSMKIVKYMISVLFLTAATLAALYFPRFYFQKYQYETVIEEMEQPSYAEFSSNRANVWQIAKMLSDESYIETNIYTQKELPEKTEADKELETKYIKMVQRVLKKYIEPTKEDTKDIKEGDYEEIPDIGMQNSIFQIWVEDWLKNEPEYQIYNVTLLNLASIFSGELINISLYIVSFEMPYQEVSMEICFSPDTEVFYAVHIRDERYYFMEDTDILFWNLDDYYKKNNEPEDALEKYKNELLTINSFEHELFIGVIK